MKNLFKATTEIKSFLALMFMGEVFISLIICLFTGQLTLTTALLWQMFAIALVVTLFQTLAVSVPALQRGPAAVRVLLHYVLLGAVLCTMVWAFGWTQSVGLPLWGLLLIYTALFAVIGGFFCLYHHLMGERFNAKLELFKRAQE